MVVALCGCKSASLLGDLKQEDANAIVVLLQQAGVAAQLESAGSGDEKVFSVLVPADKEAFARQVVAANELPRNQDLRTLLDMLKDKSLFTDEEQDREIYRRTREWELGQAVLKLPGVINASVILNIPKVDPLAQLAGAPRPRSTASVVVKHWLTPSGASLSRGAVATLIAGGIEGMAPEDVNVVMTGIPPIEPMAERRGDLTVLFVAFALLTLLLVGMVLVLVMKNRALAAALESRAGVVAANPGAASAPGAADPKPSAGLPV
ncbi:MAG: hypothetical protein U0527_10690 [Candidatus Eisenbacteria bacterium]